MANKKTNFGVPYILGYKSHPRIRRTRLSAEKAPFWRNPRIRRTSMVNFARPFLK